MEIAGVGAGARRPSKIPAQTTIAVFAGRFSLIIMQLLCHA